MTINEIMELLTILSPLIAIVGFGIGLYYYNCIDNINKSIMFYLLLMLAVDLASRIIGIYGNNLLILLVYSFLELILFTFFYYKFLFKLKHRIIITLSVIALLYIVWEILILKQIAAMKFQSYAKVVDDFMIIIMALAFFHEKINIFRETKWDYFPLNAVIIVFFSVNLIFFLPINFLINETSGLKHYFWLGNLIITLLFYSYLTHSIWKNGRTRKLLPSGSR